jgi:hypothetical protein
LTKDEAPKLLISDVVVGGFENFILSTCLLLSCSGNTLASSPFEYATWKQLAAAVTATIGTEVSLIALTGFIVKFVPGFDISYYSKNQKNQPFSLERGCYVPFRYYQITPNQPH